MTSILLSQTEHELNCRLIFNPVLAEFWSVLYPTSRCAVGDCSGQESLAVVVWARPLSFKSKDSLGCSQPHLITKRHKEKRDIHRKKGRETKERREMRGKRKTHKISFSRHLQFN